MATAFTARQGQFLAFIRGFTVKHGYAPSFDEIGVHFGVTPPSVNSMLKTLERRGLLGRLPGVARSLRVLVPAAALPSSDFGSGASGAAARGGNAPPSLGGAGDLVGAVAIAVLEELMPLVVAQANADGAAAVHEAAQAVHAALLTGGFDKTEAADVARRVASEAARWEPTGRGTVISGRRWFRRGGGRQRAAVTTPKKAR